MEAVVPAVLFSGWIPAGSDQQEDKISLALGDNFKPYEFLVFFLPICSLMRFNFRVFSKGL